MNPIITTLPPPASPAPSCSQILTKNGFTCSLITLAPGSEVPFDATSATDEQILFVVEGEAAVHFPDDVTTMLNQEAALHIPAGKEYRLEANAGSRTKLLRIGFPPRTVAEPEIVTLPS